MPCPVYTDFEEEIGAAVDVTLPTIGAGTDKARITRARPLFE
jgi:hypothetical protein